ncbi:TonB-dependent receptor [Novosphingobium sp. 9U]|uniref:TonB-dependent receptor n=1 Tax=Novosphingobium sp. 9U TaxID=2653158 RepID=UPI0012F2BC57|nr:TonB-dependent receptor [Novosphingobium sp. 9U]VWX50599.1 conserved exported hypothetical protein [Novosphingobium sp. 9U]
MKVKFDAAILAGASLMAFTASPAFAQVAADNQAAVSPDRQTAMSSSDIVVTAQRRDTLLSRTPVTVNVVSGEQLAKAQVNSEADLRVTVPGLSVRAGTSSDQLNYSMRGNSQDAFSGTRPGVLPYFNEVQIGGSGGSSAFYDLASVQVLKGPQGTLFGRSATGGAVLFSTAKPVDQFEGYASALVGNYAARKGEAMLNVPLSDEDLMFRIAGFWSKRHGYQHNLYDDSREGDMERYGFRPSLTAEFGPNVHNELVIDYYHAKGGSMIGVITGLLPPSATPGTPPFVPLQYLYAGNATPEARATGIATLAAFTGAPAAAAAGFYDAYFADPRHPSTGLLGVVADQKTRGPYVVDTNARNYYRASNAIVTNATTIDLGDTLKIKNILGYTSLSSLTSFESDGTPFDISGTGLKGSNDGYREKTEQFSNELQLIGTNIGGNLDFIVGYYFSKEKLTSVRDNRFFDIFFGGQTPNDAFILRNTTNAGFGQTTYRFGDSGFSLTAGVRYTSEKVQKVLLPGDNSYDPSGIAPPGFDYNQSRTFNRISWQFGAQYQATPELFLYAVTRRAYKSGGFVGNSAPKVGYADVSGDAFRAERVTDVEGGAKFAGRVADMPLSLNLALYHQWIVDSQRTAYTFSAADGPAAVTVNVPGGRAYGLELDGSLRPASWLTVGGNFNYIHSHFLSKPVSANGQLQVFDQVPDTPRYTGIAYADITVPVSGDLEVQLHGDVYAQTKAYTFPRSTNNLGTTIDSYEIANFRIGLNNTENGWSLTANLKNAFKKVYYVGGLPTGELYQINTLIPGEPRTFTVEGRIKF